MIFSLWPRKTSPQTAKAKWTTILKTKTSLELSEFSGPRNQPEYRQTEAIGSRATALSCASFSSGRSCNGRRDRSTGGGGEDRQRQRSGRALGQCSSRR